MIELSNGYFHCGRSAIFLICLSYFLVLAGACRISSAPTEMFVLSDGFKGGVVIVFDQPDGIIPEIKDGFVVYAIPDTGVLKVRSKATRKSAGTLYYYVRGDALVPVEYVDHWGQDRKSLENLTEDEKKDGVFVFNDGGIGTFNVGNRVISYRSFLVCSPTDKAKTYDSMMQKVFQIERDLGSKNGLL